MQLELVIALLSGLASFVGTLAASAVHMKYLRRDVDHAHKRLDIIERKIRN